MLRLDDWSRLVDPACRQSLRAVWTLGAPARAQDLDPYLEVLADPAVPCVARWIAAHALVPALRDESGAVAERLADWVRALPAGRRDAVLRPLLRTAGLRAGETPAGGGSGDAPAAASESGGAGDPAGLDPSVWVAFGLAVLDDVSPRMQRTLGWILRRVRTWPPAVRLDARRLCALLVERRAAHALVADAEAGAASAADSYADLVEPWAQNLRGADRAELEEFESRMHAGDELALADLLPVLPQVRAADAPCALRLFKRLVRAAMRGWAPLLRSPTLHAVFRTLLEAEGPRALQAVLDAYAEELTEAAAPEPGTEPSPWAASLDLPPDAAPAERNPFAPHTDLPEGEGRRFPIAYHPDFSRFHGDQSDPVAQRAGAGAFPLILEQVVAGWLEQGGGERARAALDCLLAGNALARFWEAALHLLARFPRELAPTLGVLLEDPGILSHVDLFCSCLASLKACFAFVPDRQRDAIEAAVVRCREIGHPDPMANRRFRTWLAQAIAAAGVAGRPRRAALRALLADPRDEPGIPPPSVLRDGTEPPRWEKVDDAVPCFDQLSSRHGAPMRRLWQFVRDHRGRVPTGEDARAQVPLLADLDRFWDQFHNLWWEVLRTALAAVLAAPAGSLAAEELATLRGILWGWSRRSGQREDFLTRACVATAIPPLLRHEAAAGAGTAGAGPAAEARAVLENLVNDQEPWVRHAAAAALLGVGLTAETAALWRAAAEAAADSDQAGTLEILLAGICGLADPPAAAAWAVVEAALRDAGRWHRPKREAELAMTVSGARIPTDHWAGDAAAHVAGKALVWLCARGCTPACARLRAALAAAPAAGSPPGGVAAAGARMDWCLAAGAAAALAERRDLDPECRRSLVAALLVAPIAPELRAAPDCVRRGMPGDAEAALTLAERMLAVVDGAADLEGPANSRRDLEFGAFELLRPLWTGFDRGAAGGASGGFRSRLIACVDRLLATPVYDLEVWAKWLAPGGAEAGGTGGRA